MRFLLAPGFTNAKTGRLLQPLSCGSRHGLLLLLAHAYRKKSTRMLRERMPNALPTKCIGNRFVIVFAVLFFLELRLSPLPSCYLIKHFGE